MAFQPEEVLDAARLDRAVRNLCQAFGVTELRPFQSQAGQNILLGIDTILDIPTGGGKTLAFFLPLFYHIDSLDAIDQCKKILLVVGPLNALLESQAKDLNTRGIPAVSLSSTGTGNDEQTDLFQKMEDLAANKYRVAFLGPETALGTKFHSKVLRAKEFRKNVLSLVLDEAHCVTEWGTDDFRPQFAQLATLRSRLPSGVPVLAASATLPPEVAADIRSKMGFGSDSRTISISNAKPNVALSVRTLVHPQKTYADLLELFPPDIKCREDFRQTLIYVNSRQEAEQIQDFARKHRPDFIPEEAIEFYHRFIDDERKEYLQQAIDSSLLLVSSATDALGLGMNFRFVRRVFIWLTTRTFLSLVQKIGRCVRNMAVLGEVIVFLTGASIKRYLVELEIGGDEPQAVEEPDLEESVPEMENAPMDRDAAIEDDESGPEDVVDELPATAVPQRKRKKRFGKKEKLTPLQLRDRRYLFLFLTTTKCRWIPWNEFFGNDKKEPPLFSAPSGARCCDNCHPDRFPVPTIHLSKTAARVFRGPAKIPDEIVDAVCTRLRLLRKELVERDYPRQSIITGKLWLALF
ncbi:P-loop containing nucleoside triphosphate hydrolase protein [Mycena floridula]|nr:P-loop containing nucleoside triphosphate hydrolase protein [Mycena floridula]